MPLPEEFPALRGRHKDIADYSPELLEQWITAPFFHKQHVVPSKHNLQLLAEQKFVILLRSPPKDSYEAYLRPGANPIGERLIYALNNRDSLIAELELFYQRYSVFSGHALRIYFDDLVDYPSKTLTMIFQFFNMAVDVPQEYQLARERYSGFRNP